MSKSATPVRRLHRLCTRRTLRKVTALGASLLFAAACDASPSSSSGLTRETRGDTLVLRYSGAGSWGEGARLERAATFGETEGNDTVLLGRIVALAAGDDDRVYATDGQLLSLRVFDDALRPVGLWGRSGSGPGELKNPDGGLAVLSDGRVALRDPGNARLQLFNRDGSPAGVYSVIDAGLRTRDNFGLQGDTLLSRIVVDYSGSIDQWKYGFARIAPDGRILDTVRVPDGELSPAKLVARGGGNTAELPLPFAASALARWHPAGGFAAARGDQYAVTWPRSSGFVRVERSVAATPVSAAESAQERAYITKGLQWLDPSWTWTGPDIPAVKPLLTQMFVGRDGSLWLLREGEAVDGDDPNFEPNNPALVERRLTSRLSLDVFTATGDFLGSVALPSGLQLRPEPVFSVRAMVGVEVDSSGVPRIVRYDVRTPAPR